MNSVIQLVKSIPRWVWSHSIEISETICSFFEVLWLYPAVPDQAQLLIPMDVYPHKELTLCFSSFMKQWTFSNPAICWSKGSLTIKQNLRTLSDMGTEMGSKYHNNSPFILFSGKSNDKILKIKYLILYVKSPVKYKMASLSN